MTDTILNPIKNQRGAAMVEFALMLPYMACILIFLLFTYELINEMIVCEQKNWYALRCKIDLKSPYDWGKVTLDDKEVNHVKIEIRGIMQYILGAESLRREQNLTGYTGCYHGRGLNKYRNRGKTKREIRF